MRELAASVQPGTAAQRAWSSARSRRFGGERLGFRHQCFGRTLGGSGGQPRGGGRPGRHGRHPGHRRWRRRHETIVRRLVDGGVDPHGGIPAQQALERERFASVGRVVAYRP